MSAVAVAGATLSSAPLWFISRSSGIVAFALTTVTVVLGIASTQRALASPRWPRFATQHLHRNVSLLAVALLGVHLVATIQDRYVSVGWLSLFLPFSSPYKRFGTGLGAAALDLMLLLVVTSALRLRLPLAAWRRVHLAAYALWPLSLGHFLLTGTDAKPGTVGFTAALGSLAVVAAAVALRVRTAEQPPRPVASVVR